jgi:hypothetical protein
VGADVAQGLEHGDASCAVVLAQTGASSFEEVAHYHTQSPPDVFAAGLHQLASAYPGRLGVEINGPGYQVLYKLRELKTERTPYRLYHDPKSPLKLPAGRLAGNTAELALPGWQTTGASKPIAIGELEEAIRKGWLTLHSRLTYEQMRMYQRLPDGKTSAPPNKHDDCVMAWAIAWQMRKLPIDTQPRTITLDTGFGPRQPERSAAWPS